MPPRSSSLWMRAGHRTLVPLALIVLCPPSAILAWHTHTALGGSLAALWGEFRDDGVLATVWRVWRPVMFGSRTAWLMLGAFAAFQLALARLVPGPPFRGPITPAGNVPVYRKNGPACFAITMAAFALCAGPLRLFSPTVVYDHFGELLGALNVASLALCLVLYLKGRFRPSSSDASTSGNPVFDYYWGTELYPRILGWDVKQMTNCRLGMMGWAVIIVSFAAAQAARHGLADSMIVAVAIQLVYIAKFFGWETGYLASLDIMHDRAGFYICWGCLVWVPAIYASSTLYLVDHPARLGAPLAALALAAGVAAVLTNYLADAQRQRVRATGGRTTVWGKPPRLIRARVGDRESLLLTSGFWGLARHFHYLPEVAGAFFWTLPAGFTHALPWFYVVFLSILLTHRALRDDRRCAAKYGRYWEEYCARVPYRIIPGLF